MDGDRGDAQLLRGAKDAKGDFAAIGDQDFFEHFSAITGDQPAAGRYSTGCESSTRMAVTVPLLCATMSLNVFIASTSSTFWPSVTCGADLDEGLGVGARAQIDRADHRRFQRVGVVVRPAGGRAARRPARRRGGGGDIGGGRGGARRRAAPGARRECAGRPSPPRFRSGRFRSAAARFRAPARRRSLGSVLAGRGLAAGGWFCSFLLRPSLGRVWNLALSGARSETPSSAS